MAPSKVVKKFSTKKAKKEDVEMKQAKAEDVSEQSSSDSSDSDSSDSEEEVKEEEKEEEKDSDSSDSSDSSNSSDEEEEEEEKVNDKKRKASEDSEEENEEEEEEEEEEKEDKKEVKKQKTNVSISREEPPRFGGEGLSIWVGQLNFDASKDEVQEFFEKAGKVTSVRMAPDNRGGKQNRGFCYVDFETAEDVEAAKKLNGEEFLGRNIRIDDATTAKPRQKDEKYSAKSKTVFVANLSHDLNEEGIREAFESFGTIHEVRMPWNKEADRPKGIAYIEFDSIDEAEKAVLEMNGVRVNNRPVRTDFAGSKPDNNSRPNFRGGRGGGGFGGGRGGGFGGGRGGGFRGGRGGRR